MKKKGVRGNRKKKQRSKLESSPKRTHWGSKRLASGSKNKRVGKRVQRKKIKREGTVCHP